MTAGESSSGRSSDRVREPVAGVSSGRALTDELRGATLLTFNAIALYDALDIALQRRLVFRFDDANRTHWNFLPEAGRGQRGVAIKELDRHQELLLHRMIGGALSLEGYARFVTVLGLEHMLRQIDEPRMGGLATEFRNPGNYYLTFYGEPQLDSTWGWRLVGHHVSLNFTVIGQELVLGTPILFGSQPGRIGPIRPLAAEEDIAFALLLALSEAEREVAVFHPVAPPDFVTRCQPEIGQVERPSRHGDGRRDVLITDEDREALRFVRDEPRGLAHSEMPPAAQRHLEALLDLYLGRLADPWRKQARDRIESAGIDSIRFGWAGGSEPGDQHYYRLQGPVTLIEFVNSEDNANHVHSVWRDLDRDFAVDLLASEG
jgi:Protein of unknown function (DUF3500)